MFRTMRRSAQQLSADEARAILQSAASGVLALAGDDDYPYAVPMSFVSDGDQLYFHSAVQGHKADAVQRLGKCSFCVVAQDEIIPLEYTTYYKSVIAFGRIRVVEDKDEWLRAIRLIADKYAPHHPTGPEKEIAASMGHMLILRMDIEHLTGKQARELAKKANPDG